MTYLLDFRKKVLEMKVREKLSFDRIAERFGISRAAIFRWTKNIEPKKSRDKKPVKINMESLRQDIELYPGSYCYERAARLGASPAGVRKAKRRLGVTYKKTLKHPKADQEQRSIFCQEIQELKYEGRAIAYIDESGFAHDMPRTHGYSDKGKRCYGIHDFGSKGRTNAIGAMIG